MDTSSQRLGAAPVDPVAASDPAGAGWPRLADGMRDIWARGRAVERFAYVLALLLMLSGLAHLGVLLVTGSTWDGPVSFRKPLTFGLSFGLTLLTITWVASLLTIGRRLRRWLLGLFSLACLLEVALITVQAWRGVPSHYNLETPLDSLIARTLAGGAVGLIGVIVTLTALAFRRQAETPPALRLAIRAGLVTLNVALAVGAVMIGIGISTALAGEQNAAYTIATGLKPAHAVTMHAVLLLPALAWLLGYTGWSARRQRRFVWLATGSYALRLSSSSPPPC